jgi:hypothetical protein
VANRLTRRQAASELDDLDDDEVQGSSEQPQRQKRHPVTSELDDLADSVQGLSQKYPRHAKRLMALAANLDTVSNQLDTEAKRAGRTAAGDPDAEQGAWNPEDVYQDSYEADDYHKAPIGNDSLAKAIDKNPADILSDLDFAQSTSGKDKHRILVQADRKRPSERQAAGSWPFKDLTPADLTNFARNGEWDKVSRAASMVLGSSSSRGRQAGKEWPFEDLTPTEFTEMARRGEWNQIRRAASMVMNSTRGRTSAKVESDPDMDVDIGTFGSEDRLSTADLGESGDEEIAKPNDADQEGGTLQFYGTYAQTANDAGPDSGHHRRNVEAPNRETRGDISAGRRSRTRARSVIERMADRQVKPEVKDPDALLDDEPGDNVERDQPLGGLSGQYRGRKSARNGGVRRNGHSNEDEVKVYRPVHVPKEMHGLWHRAAQRIASEGRLLDRSGDVDYYTIDDKYRGALKFYRGRAAAATRGRTASQRVAYQETPRQVRVSRPEFVPLELLPYWNGAAEYQGKNNRLVTASGKLDYDGINRQYCRLLDKIVSIPAD